MGDGESGPGEGAKSGGLRLIIVALPLLLFVGLAGIFTLQLLSGRDTSELPSALIGKSAPTFSLQPLEGLRAAGNPVPGLSDANLRGDRPTLVNIFASWCGPCRAEHPVLMALAKEGDLQIVGINYKDQPGNALRFLGALGNPYSRVGVDRAGRAAVEWGVFGVPESLLVDGEGIVRHKIIGPITAAKLAELREVVAEVR